MVRLKDLPDYEQEHLMSKLLPPLGPLPWIKPKKNLNEMKIAILTTAGLNYRNEDNFLQMQVSEPFPLKQKAKIY